MKILLKGNMNKEGVTTMRVLGRKKTYDFRSFMDGRLVPPTPMAAQVSSIAELDMLEESEGLTKKFTKYSLFPLAIAPFFTSVSAHAETASNVEVVEAVSTADIQSKMMTAFDPLIGLIQGLAYPVAMVVVLGGAIFVMIGNSDRGFGMMQKAGLGYLLVMIAPMVLDVLVDSMKGVV